MKLSDPRLKWWAGGVGLLGAGAYAFVSMYATPKQDIETDLAGVEASIRSLEKSLDAETDTRRRIRELGATTLGRREDVVTHRFRTALTRLGERQGLTGVVVETSDAKAERNPVTDARGVSTSLKRELRAESGFVILRGRLVGTGTYEQALGVIAAAQSQPWAHRVEGFGIEPLGKERQSFKVSVDVATLVAPGWTRDEGTEPQLAELTPAAEAAWKTLSLRNPFVKPAATAGAVTRGPEHRPAQQTLPAYEDWKLAGVMSGRSGESAIVVNAKTGERVTLLKGGAVLDAVFVEGSGEKAVFEIAGKRFEVKNGETLASRRPLG